MSDGLFIINSWLKVDEKRRLPKLNVPWDHEPDNDAAGKHGTGKSREPAGWKACATVHGKPLVPFGPAHDPMNQAMGAPATVPASWQKVASNEPGRRPALRFMGSADLQNWMHFGAMNQRHRSAAVLGCGFWRRLAASSDTERDAR